MVYILTQYDPFFVGSFLREISNWCPSDKSEIILLPNFQKGKFNGLKKFIKLYGYKHTIFSVFKIFNGNYKFPKKLNYKKLNNKNQLINFINHISENDIIVSISAPYRIPIETLNKKVRAINIHCGKLPKYAGMMPIFWQMYNKEKYITITLHHMNEKIDEGSIILEKEMLVNGSLFETSIAAKKLSSLILYEYLNEDSKNNIEKKNNHSQKNLKKNVFPSKKEIEYFNKTINE